MELPPGLAQILKTGLRSWVDFREGVEALGSSASRAFAEDDS